ncbi:MAG: M48 family metalloprotease [Iamia sp.]
MAVDDLAAQNKRLCSLILGASFGLVAIVLALLALLDGLGLIGVVVALVVAGAVTAGAWWAAPGLVIRMSGAQPVGRDAEARLHNLLDGLCAANGVAKPTLHLIDDPAVNAFAAGRMAEHASIAVTRGLLDHMSRVELEAVLAHTLSLIKNDDILVDSLAVTSPVGARLVHRARPRTREPWADLTAVEMTRYPPALAAALAKMRDADTAIAVSPRLMAHLWIADPTGGPPGGPTEVRRFDDHPTLEERIAALQEL